MAVPTTRLALEAVMKATTQVGRIIFESDLEDVAALTAELPTCAKGGSFTLVCSDHDSGEARANLHNDVLTVFFRETALSYNSAPAFRNSVETVWLHKESNGTWRVGTALSGGTTLASSATVASTGPPIHGWHGADGELIPSLVCVDSHVWSGLACRVLASNLKDLRENTDDENVEYDASQTEVVAEESGQEVVAGGSGQEVVAEESGQEEGAEEQEEPAQWDSGYTPQSSHKWADDGWSRGHWKSDKRKRGWSGWQDYGAADSAEPVVRGLSRNT